MARMSSKVRREFDAAAAITLRDITDGAETADAAEAGVELGTLTDAYWDNNEVPNGYFIVNIHVSEISFVNTDEVYDLYVEVDTGAGFSTAKEVGRLKSVPATGYYTIVVDSETVEKLEAGATHIRIRLDGTSATGFTITYGAWLTFLGA